MAKKHTRDLEIRGRTKGVKQSTKQVKDLGAATDKTQKSLKKQNTELRNQTGVYKQSLAEGKNFSRQAQGLGGVVRAYATIAANVFALSSAFLVMKRAADFDSMVISAESLEKRMGTSVLGLAKDMQEATGANLDLRQALESTNRALSAGFDPRQIKALGETVAKASQTFGGSIEANMNRVTQAILRGRTETLATMGIVIDLEKAYRDYGTSIGKTTDQLTKLEKQQATLNAFLKEGQNQLGDVQLDPNPYDKMLRQLQDMSQNFLSILQKSIFNPLINLINESEGVAKSLIVTLGAIFARQLTPGAATYAANARKSIQSVIEANRKRAFAEATLERKRLKAAQKNFDALRLKKIQEVQAWAREEMKKPEVAAKASSAIRTIAEATEQDIISGAKNVNRALATVQSQITRLQKNPKAIASSSVREAVAKGKGDALLGAAALSVGKQSTNADKALRSLSLSADTLATKLRVLTTNTVATVNGLRKQAASARLSTLALIEQNGVVLGTVAAYKHAVRALRLLEKENLRVSKSYVVAATAARLFGTTIALVGAAVNKAIPFLATLWFAFEIGKSIWERFRRDTDKSIANFKEKLKEGEEALQTINKRLADFQALLQRTGSDKSFLNLSRQFDFVANAIAEVTNELSELNSSIIELTNPKIQGNVVGILDHINALEKERTTLVEERQAFFQQNSKELALGYDRMGNPLPSTLELLNEMGDSTERLTNNAQQTNLAFERLNALAEATVDIFNSTNTRLDFVDALRGFSGLPAIKTDVIEGLRKLGTTAGTAFAQALESNSAASIEEIKAQLENRNLDPKELTTALAFIQFELDKSVEKTKALVNAIKSFSDIGSKVAEFTTDAENVFLNKAKLSEQVELIKDLSNNLKTVLAGDLTEEGRRRALETFKEGEGANILKFLGLDPTSLEELDASVTGILNKYRGIAETLVTAPILIKTNKANQDITQSLQKRTTSLTEIGRLERQLQEQKREELALNIKILEAQAEQINIQLLNKNLNSDVVRLMKLERDALVAQANAIKAQRKLINPLLEEQRKLYTERKDILDKQLASINAYISSEQTLKNLLGTTTGIYQKQQKIFDLRQKAIDNQIQSLREEMQFTALEITMGGPNVQEAQKRLITLESQIYTLMTQQISLARESQRTSLELLARTGNFEANRNTFLLEFIKAGEQVAQTLESAGARFGKEALSAMDKTFDLIIDNLLEGEGSFGESLKAIGRESIGNILKENVKSLARTGLANVAQGIFGQSSVETDPVKLSQNQLQELEKQSALLLTLVSASGISAEQLQGIASQFPSLTNALSQLFGQMSLGVGPGVTTDWTSSIIYGLIGGFAQGGIIKGGLNRYASGTITNGPELAMIGEGPTREAVIPLPNNKEVPVQLLDGGGQEININQVFDFRDANPTTETRLRAAAANIKRETFAQVFNEINKGGRYAKMTGRR